MKWIAVSVLLLMASVSHAGKIESIFTRTLDKRYLVDNRLIITSYRCGGNNDGVYVDFFDRESYKPLASLRVLGCDDDFQDFVHNFYKAGGEYLAPVEFRYKDSDRPSLIVINPKNFTIKKRLSCTKAAQEHYEIRRREFKSAEDRRGDVRIFLKHWNGSDYVVERGSGSSKQVKTLPTNPRIQLISYALSIRTGQLSLRIPKNIFSGVTISRTWQRMRANCFSRGRCTKSLKTTERPRSDFTPILLL